MTYILDIPCCLINAEKRISDAAHLMETVMRSDASGNKLADLHRRAKLDFLAYEREAREFYAEARKSGWDGDENALIAAHWAVYLPAVSAERIVKFRKKALAGA